MRVTIDGFNPFVTPAPETVQAPDRDIFEKLFPSTVTRSNVAPVVSEQPAVNPFIPVMHAAPLSAPADPNNPYSQLPLYAALKACTACTARAEALQVVPGFGPIDARILVIGQNPGLEEDRAGVPFVGSSGDEFNSWLTVLGLDRSKLVVTNVCKCHTNQNRVPRTKEIKTCADLWLSRELAELSAVEVIIPLGKPAVLGVLGKSAPPMTPLMVHHYKVRAYGRELRVFPLPHPAFLLRVAHMKAMFRETILGQLKLTMLQEVPEAYRWTKK